MGNGSLGAHGPNLAESISVYAKPLLAGGIVLCLGMGLIWISVFQTIRQTSAVDEERTAGNIRAVLELRTQQMANLANDNSNWDDAAKAVYSANIEYDFFDRAWGSAAEDASNYDTIYVLNPDDEIIYRAGKGPTDPTVGFGPSFRILLGQLNGSKPVSGMLADASGVYIAGASEITPTSDNFLPQVPTKGPARIVLAKRIDRKMLDEVGKLTSSSRLHLAAIDGENEIALTDVSGGVAAYLAWAPLQSGGVIITRAIPAILPMAVILFFIVFVVMCSSFQNMRRLQLTAMSDALTGLPNRRKLLEAMNKSSGAQASIAVGIVDLDGFKGVNDYYGHGVGDSLIREVARQLNAAVNSIGIVARLGGDEFAIMIQGDGAQDKIERIAADFLGGISKSVVVDERNLNVGASIGLTCSASSQTDPTELLRQADLAMYAAKRSGKMRFYWFTPALDKDLTAERVLETELRSAIEQGALNVAYQPLVSASNGRLVAVEALARWWSPILGSVSPADFIPVAEKTGLIDEIGLWILRQACLDGIFWGEITVSVNISVVQLRNPDLALQIANILTETGFPAQRLELEVTETSLVTDPAAARRTLNELSALGISLSLDDFGTGYASIGFLRQFAFDKLKIDRSLVVDVEANESARAILQASVVVARSMNMKVAAEGVETLAQAKLMTIAGCDQLQGWHFSKAVPAEEINAKFGIRQAHRA